MPEDKVAMCCEITVNIPLHRVLMCSTFLLSCGGNVEENFIRNVPSV
jgi:hypothetical protein